MSRVKHLATVARVLSLILGVVAIQAGWKNMFAWNALGENYKAYYALKLFFGLVLFGEALFAIRQRSYSGLHLLVISGTALTLAGVQFVGLATNSILCSTPT
jgi:hypothetical protein